MRNPLKRKSAEERRLAEVNARLAKHREKAELAKAEATLAALDNAERYATADPSERARMDVEAEVAREQRHARASRHSAGVAARIAARKARHPYGPRRNAASGGGQGRGRWPGDDPRSGIDPGRDQWNAFRL